MTVVHPQLHQCSHPVNHRHFSTQPRRGEVLECFGRWHRSFTYLKWTCDFFFGFLCKLSFVLWHLLSFFLLFTILVEFTSVFDIFSFNFYNKHQIGHKFPIVFVFFLKILALLFDVCFDIQIPNSCPFWYSCSAFAIQLQILALFGIFVSFWYSTPNSCPFGILLSFLALLPPRCGQFSPPPLCSLI